jgi:hypothetical protein
MADRASTVTRRTVMSALVGVLARKRRPRHPAEVPAPRKPIGCHVGSAFQRARRTRDPRIGGCMTEMPIRADRWSPGLRARVRLIAPCAEMPIPADMANAVSLGTRLPSSALRDAGCRVAPHRPPRWTVGTGEAELFGWWTDGGPAAKIGAPQGPCDAGDSPVGAWRSQVARIVRDDEVGGSNPLAPTISFIPGPKAAGKPRA